MARGGAQKKDDSVAVAMDKDKFSEHALRWTVERLLSRGQGLTLLHVKQKPSNSTTDVSANSELDEDVAHKQQLENEARDQFFHPFHRWCARLDIPCNEVMLENAEISNALINYVNKNVIDILVLGSPSRTGIVKRFKTDIPSIVSKGAPDFCTVYVIGNKGKVCSIRQSTAPAPAKPIAPACSQLQPAPPRPQLLHQLTNTSEVGAEQPNQPRPQLSRSFPSEFPKPSSECLGTINALRQKYDGGIDMKVIITPDSLQRTSLVSAPVSQSPDLSSSRLGHLRGLTRFGDPFEEEEFLHPPGSTLQPIQIRVENFPVPLASIQGGPSSSHLLPSEVISSAHESVDGMARVRRFAHVVHPNGHQKVVSQEMPSTGRLQTNPIDTPYCGRDNMLRFVPSTMGMVASLSGKRKRPILLPSLDSDNLPLERDKNLVIDVSKSPHADPSTLGMTVEVQEKEVSSRSPQVEVTVTSSDSSETALFRPVCPAKAMVEDDPLKEHANFLSDNIVNYVKGLVVEREPLEPMGLLHYAANDASMCMTQILTAANNFRAELREGFQREQSLKAQLGKAMDQLAIIASKRDKLRVEVGTLKKESQTSKFLLQGEVDALKEELQATKALLQSESEARRKAVANLSLEQERRLSTEISLASEKEAFLKAQADLRAVEAKLADPAHLEASFREMDAFNDFEQKVMRQGVEFVFVRAESMFPGFTRQHIENAFTRYWYPTTDEAEREYKNLLTVGVPDYEAIDNATTLLTPPH